MRNRPGLQLILDAKNRHSEELERLYPLDFLPGGAFVQLPFGLTRYFLFGPEDGEKVEDILRHRHHFIFLENASINRTIYFCIYCQIHRVELSTPFTLCSCNFTDAFCTFLIYEQPR